MPIKPVSSSQKEDFDRLAAHPLQSWAWGEFRQKMGQKVARFGIFEGQKMVGSFQLFFHHLPHLSYTVGYFPKGPMPTPLIIKTLKKVGQENKAIFIKLEPNIQKSEIRSASRRTKSEIKKLGLIKGKPLFTRHTLIIDLQKSEEELMASFASKTRYNIRLAQKRGVKIVEDNSQKGFEQYWQLMEETTKRQKFYAHNKAYHQLMWQEMSRAGIAHLLRAVYKKETLAAWILFAFNGVLYYPYGASTRRHQEVMASNLMMWEAIRLGKSLGCKKFDLWGTPGPDPKPDDPWFGFHRFKMGYRPEIVEFIGTYDLVLRPVFYQFYLWADKIRWQFLRLKA